MEHLNRNHASHGVVLGAGHGIGLACTEALLNQCPQLNLLVSYRDEAKASPLQEARLRWGSRLEVIQIDPTQEKEIEILKNRVKQKTSELEIFLNSVGFLHTPSCQPERSLREIDLSQLQRYFTVNSIVTPLAAKHLFPFFHHSSPSLFCTISAKVGSIADNRLGGWYGYRASKAALNMFIKNISLEFQRRGCNTVVTALHPGTVETELSEPFRKHISHQVFRPEEAGQLIVETLLTRQKAHNGAFFAYDGEELPW